MIGMILNVKICEKSTHFMNQPTSYLSMYLVNFLVIAIYMIKKPLVIIKKSNYMMLISEELLASDFILINIADDPSYLMYRCRTIVCPV